MSLTSIKSKLQAQRGFTIVELLIVIVVIGILAAITIVAYSGVTSRANAAKAQTNAATVQKVVEAYAADPTINTGFYPGTIADVGSYSGTTRLPQGITLVAPADCTSTSTTATCLAATGTYEGTKNIIYAPITTSSSTNTGVCIGWYDFQNAQTKWVYAGAAKVVAITSSAPVCTAS